MGDGGLPVDEHPFWPGGRNSFDRGRALITSMIVATQFYTSDIIIILGISHYKLGPGVPPKLPIKIIVLLLPSPHMMVTMITFHLASEVLHAASVDTSTTDNTNS